MKKKKQKKNIYELTPLPESTFVNISSLTLKAGKSVLFTSYLGGNVVVANFLAATYIFYNIPVSNV